MKRIILIFALLLTVYGFAQKANVQTEKVGDLTKATYYYENGNIEQQGTFNSEGKLHGEWVSYDVNGEKLAIGKYDNGKKVGKWLFWQKGVVKEVDYKDSKITNVNDRTQ
jgi:antitoxin component YwqK of YwqJK toxin-antitoxin module